MAIYSGKNTSGVDIIAADCVTKKDVLKIYEELCPTQVGELRYTTQINSLTDKGLIQDEDGVWRIQNGVDFDGWAYPDGSRFSAEDFPEAATEYGSQNGIFSVPCIDDTFFAGTASSISAVEQKCGLQRHEHTITDSQGLSAMLTIKNGFVFCAAGNCGSYRMETYYTHYQTKVGKYRDNVLTAVVDLSSVKGLSALGHSAASSIISVHIDEVTGEEISTQMEPNYDPCIVRSKKYNVMACHSGAVNYTPSADTGDERNFLPMPIDMKVTADDIGEWFNEGKTEEPTIDQEYPAYESGTFKPESVNIPVAIYIGSKYF